MRAARVCSAVSASLLLAVCLGCGGGGGAPPAPVTPPPTLLATLKAVLLGSLETTVVDPDARATFLVDLRDDGTLEFACTAEAAWVGDISGTHIHRGAAGTDGPVVVDLLGDGATFDPGTLTAVDDLAIDPVLAGEIATSPGDFYVNVHTGAAPAGFVRQQLAPLAPMEAAATLLGTEEVPVQDASARGAVTLAVGADKAVTVRLAMRSPAVGEVTAAHIHVGEAGVNGPILVDLDPASASLDASTGVLTATITPTLEALARICNDLGAFYVNAHTAAAPGGLARGQLAEDLPSFWAPLRAAEVTTPPSDPGARGGVTLNFDSLTSGRAHLAVPPDDLITAVTAARVRAGAAGSDGPALLDLQAGADYIASPSSFSAEGEIAPDPALLTRLMADPSSLYVQFETAADPTGSVRGQLTRDPVTFAAVLRGDEETTVVDPLASGTATVIVQDAFACSFSIRMTRPAANTVQLAHVHDAPAGSDGPILIDLLGGSPPTISGPFITGDTRFTGRTLARLLAVPERFYANVHTATAPAGMARGQLVRLTQDTPPTGLTYQTPVTYTEGTPIPDNVPLVVGAVSAYGVSPALPAGLQFDAVTGIISGTPSSAAPAADYTVTASNAAGVTMATVNITVDPVPPTNLSYTSPVTYTTDTAIAPNVPSSDGGQITSYAVSPALPAGLSLNATTGVISGTPTATQSAKTHTVTGSNAAGSTTFDIQITVNSSLQPPSGLSYTTPVTYTTGSPVTPNVPTVGGGAVDSYSVSPALPAGLSLNTTTGVISGTPTATSAAANHTVTATNAAGSTTAVVNITVNLGAPTNLTYSNNPNVAYVGTPIAPMSPTSQGGAVSSYSVSPALPFGLMLNGTTGVISGTPTATAAQANYTVTATNAAGSTTATVTIVVY